MADSIYFLNILFSFSDLCFCVFRFSLFLSERGPGVSKCSVVFMAKKKKTCISKIQAMKKKLGINLERYL